jgi:hypothetical protein
MHKKIAALLLLLLSISTTSAFAEDSFWADDSSPQGQIGLVWYEDVLRSGNGISALTAYGNNNSFAVCDSLSDPDCTKMQSIVAEIMLPVCSGDKYKYCIEGLSVGKSNESLKEGKYLRSVKGATVAAEPSSNLPAGSTTSIWQVAGATHTGGNDNYSVGARLRYSINNGRLNLINFETSIVPFREATGSNYQYMEMKVVNFGGRDQLVHYWHVGNCIWQEPGLCGVATRWAADSVASISLRVPNNVTGWLHGRLEDPNILVKNIDATTNLITVTAKPVTVQGSAPKVKVNEISPELMKVITRNGAEPLRSDSGYVWQMEPASYNLDWFNGWLPLTKDKADGFSDYWNFKSIAGNFTSAAESKCLASTQKLVGLVTTNSLWYSGNPPAFKDSELNYKVAALHFNPDGITPFLGTYDLVLDSTAARCLYGYSSAPIQASLSILSSNGENQVATTTLTENNGWLKLSAKGFTFSDPTIKVKFTQAGNKTVADAPNTTIAPKKSTISCMKGKTTKKITGVKPVCPTGYKKS